MTVEVNGLEMGSALSGLTMEFEGTVKTYKFKKGERKQLELILNVMCDQAPEDAPDWWSIDEDEKFEVNLTESDLDLIERVTGLNVRWTETTPDQTRNQRI